MLLEYHKVIRLSLNAMLSVCGARGIADLEYFDTRSGDGRGSSCTVVRPIDASKRPDIHKLSKVGLVLIALSTEAIGNMYR